MDPGFLPTPRKVLSWLLNIYASSVRAKPKEKGKGFSVADVAASRGLEEGYVAGRACSVCSCVLRAWIRARACEAVLEAPMQRVAVDISCFVLLMCRLVVDISSSMLILDTRCLTRLVSSALFANFVSCSDGGQLRDTAVVVDDETGKDWFGGFLCLECIYRM